MSSRIPGHAAALAPAVRAQGRRESMHAVANDTLGAEPVSKQDGADHCLKIHKRTVIRCSTVRRRRPSQCGRTWTNFLSKVLVSWRPGLSRIS